MQLSRFVFIAGLATAIGTIAVPDAAAVEKVESTPVEGTVVLDGDDSDWNPTPSIYLEESLRAVSIAHDRENLFIMFRFADRDLARIIMRRGVILWFNGDGKAKTKDEDFAVRYPGSQQISENLDSGEFHGDGWRIADTDASGHPYPPGELASLRQVPGRLTVIRMGFKEPTAENSADGPAAESKYAGEHYCYELRIPFADIGGRIAEAAQSKNRKIAVGVEIGGLTSAEREMIRSAKRARGDDIDKRPSGVTGGTFGARRGGTGEAGSQSFEDRWKLDPEIHWLVLNLAPL